jgi:hypothetical protein
MTKKEKQVIDDLIFKISDEGLSYTLNDYSDWKEIEKIDPVLYSMIQEFKKYSRSIEEHLEETYLKIWEEYA